MNAKAFILFIIFVLLSVVSRTIEINNEHNITNKESFVIQKDDTSLPQDIQTPVNYINENITKPYGFLIKNIFHHNHTCFTQGLLIDPQTDNIIESCGQYGQSYITVYNPVQKKVFSRKALPKHIFGEGIGLLGNTLLAISWKEKSGFIYQLENNKLKLKKTISYKTSNNEGWGVATGFWKNEEVYFISDGSCNIMIWNSSFHEIERKCITDPFSNDRPVYKINEMEIIGNYIFANIWMDTRIAVIDYEEAKVVKWLDFSVLKRWIKNNGDTYQQTNRVLNGIAYNAKTKSIFITGKLWNRMFEIELLYPV